MNPAMWLILLAVSAQTERPAFEVASVKVSKPTNGPLRVTAPDGQGGITYTNVTLKNCIRRAYGVMQYQISGGPAWLDTERFVIDAKAASGAPHSQLMLMLQSLLEDRFKLALHHEKREIPAYDLTVAKGGPKLKPAKDENAMQIDSNAQHALIATGVSIQQLAGALRLDRPIFDATGLTGVYDLTLDYPQDDPFGIFTSLQELGLKLEQRKHMVEMLVIDGAEKPSDN